MSRLSCRTGLVALDRGPVQPLAGKPAGVSVDHCTHRCAGKGVGLHQLAAIIRALALQLFCLIGTYGLTIGRVFPAKRVGALLAAGGPGQGRTGRLVQPQCRAIRRTDDGSRNGPPQQQLAEIRRVARRLPEAKA